MAVSASESFNPYSALRIGPEEADPFPGERQNDVYHKDVAIPKESDLGQVGLQRRQICPRSASFSMIDGKWLSGRRFGNWSFLYCRSPYRMTGRSRQTSKMAFDF